MQIRLGDNSVTSVTKCFSGLIYMGDDVGFQSQLHVMTELPSEFDAFIGMDWMINYDAWIQGRR
eukprot:SAG31_NODE_1437_length_8339_cov_26.148058_8_plen_64_part_00